MVTYAPFPTDPFTKSAATWLVVQNDDPEKPGIRDVHSGAEGSGASSEPFAEF